MNEKRYNCDIAQAKIWGHKKDLMSPPATILYASYFFL
jgi:hypothetical protein